MDSMAFHSWTPRMSRDFGEAIVKARHRLQENELFSDEALAALIEKHPRNLSDFNTPGVDTEALRPGEIEDLSGMALLSAAHQGRLWINLRRAMNIHPEYRELIESAFSDLRRLTPRFRPTKYNGDVLISAPSARAAYRQEKEDVILWHVRGVKRVYVYPSAQPYFADEDMEARALGAQSPRLPYRSDYERDVRSFELTPGDMLAWPLHSPHRVENVRGLNVSIRTEYSNWRSSLSNGLYYTNAVLRRRFGRTPPPAADARLPEQIAKFALSGAFRAVGLGAAPAEPALSPGFPAPVRA